MVLDHLNLTIKSGERLVLLGPSGCGKSTTLRIIAGLSDITSGQLILNQQVANNLEAKDRNISMVFQNYALYPHMTVAENISYGLKINKVPKEEIQARLQDALTTLQLEGLEDRKPKDLSGGQRQRVALARALVKKTDYFLLDEPLSNLDAQLRLHARKELVKIHEKYHMTLIYVTHDQVEAMTIGQRIVLLNQGKVQMADTPYNIYNHPKNVFTAKFIGSPSMNIIPAQVKNQDLYLGDQKIDLSPQLAQRLKTYPKKQVYLGIRPEHIQIKKNKGLLVEINYLEDYGNHLGLYFKLGGQEYVAMTRDQDYSRFKEKEEIHLTFDTEKISLFDIDTEENLEA